MHKQNPNILLCCTATVEEHGKSMCSECPFHQSDSQFEHTVGQGVILHRYEGLMIRYKDEKAFLIHNGVFLQINFTLAT